MEDFKRLIANVGMAAVVAGLTALAFALQADNPHFDRALLAAVGVVVLRAAVGAALVGLKKPLPVDKPPEV